MKYIKFICDTGFYDTEEIIYEAFEDDISDTELDQTAYEYAIENAENYEWLVDDDEEDSLDEYYDSVFGNWVEVTKEEYESRREG